MRSVAGNCHAGASCSSGFGNTRPGFDETRHAEPIAVTKALRTAANVIQHTLGNDPPPPMPFCGHPCGDPPAERIHYQVANVRKETDEEIGD